MFDTTKQHFTYSTPPHKMIHGDAKEYCEELEDGPFEIVKPFESEEKSFFDKISKNYWIKSDSDVQATSMSDLGQA